MGNYLYHKANKCYHGKEINDKWRITIPFESFELTDLVQMVLRLMFQHRLMLSLFDPFMAFIDKSSSIMGF